MKKSSSTMPTRRRFLGEASCSAVGATSLLSSLINLRLTGSLAAAEDEEGDYKALVCVFLAGGNDSFNMLAPIDEEVGYPQYLAARGRVALPRTSFEALGDPLPAPDGRTLGLNQRMSGLKSLFEDGKAAFVSNVGTVVEPITKLGITEKTANLPLGLYSHSDQQKHWQSGLPSDRSPISGWGGRIADLLNDLNGESLVSMNVSLAGLNMFQSGQDTAVLSRTPAGVGSIRDWDKPSFQATRAAAESILDAEYQNAFQRAFASSKRQAIEASAQYRTAVESVDPIASNFSQFNLLSIQLKAVAETIAARDVLCKRRQTFFVELGGWDHHNGLASHPSMLSTVSTAISQFQAAMVELGVEDQVTLFTASDFGRTLTPNGSGTDHAWGGHQFVVGGAVDGGKIYGQYPSLELGNDLDTGRGRFIPTTSVDQYAADLALWMGVSPGNLGLVFPNLANFSDVVADGPPVGFMKTPE